MTDKVLLTGISGWIAKHIAIELLNSGYEVLGTVRNQNSLEKTKKTLNEYVSIDKLSFVELDLLKDDGWVEAAKDCKYIIHTASPYPMKIFFTFAPEMNSKQKKAHPQFLFWK